MTVTIHPRSIAGFAAGVFVTLFATAWFVSAWRADAAPGDTDATFVPVTPCRLFDFRSGSDNVGPKSSPLGPGEVHVVQVTGANGNCNGIPSAAKAVALNVTIVNPTAQSNLRLYPADAASPLVSNLNWLAGQSPTPNKVDVKLSPDGRIKLENHAGTVDVIGDVVGYYSNSSLVEIHDRLTALETAQPFAVHASGNQDEFVSSVDEVVRSVTITAPVDGTVTVTSSNDVLETTSNHGVQCSITTETVLDLAHAQVWRSGGFPNEFEQMAGTRGFPIAAGETVAYNLVCEHFGGDASQTAVVIDSAMTAIFTPAP